MGKRTEDGQKNRRWAKEQRMVKRIEDGKKQKAPGQTRAPEPRSPELQISWLEAAKYDHNWVNKQNRGICILSKFLINPFPVLVVRIGSRKMLDIAKITSRLCWFVALT